MNVFSETQPPAAAVAEEPVAEESPSAPPTAPVVQPPPVSYSGENAAPAPSPIEISQSNIIISESSSSNTFTLTIKKYYGPGYQDDLVGLGEDDRRIRIAYHLNSGELIIYNSNSVEISRYRVGLENLRNVDLYFKMASSLCPVKVRIDRSKRVITDISPLQRRQCDPLL